MNAGLELNDSGPVKVDQEPVDKVELTSNASLYTAEAISIEDHNFEDLPTPTSNTYKDYIKNLSNSGINISDLSPKGSFKEYHLDDDSAKSSNILYTDQHIDGKDPVIMHNINVITEDSGYSRPETPYNKFLERLKHHSCIDIVNAIKGLIVMLPGTMSRTEVAAITHNFIDIYTPKLISLGVFEDMSDNDFVDVIEGFEKFTIQKLYPQCYRMDPMDPIEDELLDIQIKCLSWIKPQHLEISVSGDHDILEDAQTQLKNIHKYKAPRDKLIAILNTCRLIVYSIQKISNRDVSADEAFPLLIYTIIRSNPRELHSSIEFIQNFRHPSRHVSEEAYAFTLLVSAVEYIRAIGKTAHLKLSSEEFESLYDKCKINYKDRLEELNIMISAKPENEPTQGDSLINQLKKFASPRISFKMPLFSRTSSKYVQEIMETLDYLESYLVDLPLIYQHDEHSTIDSPALLSDWRALTAMRKHVIETIAKLRTQVDKLL
ncbi:hypothetical protein BEWA_024870 [Theileria equi strain WA]|uniref:VPS9 domain-containing protein n=1 Tax=Theileria equi strain WA TaxID=1537102 RepID=L0AWK4_THEEQ|nr:hypothetical protein BEWA_024870 [Theileria equi strain WA]AFZ79638.1 hypothetical protein BEWA_024870 [Theileria equi strain WA]|eukprot:XP_004829304.1 hypothetical protein BEWA_024870 [Theileria equi strain WA]